MSKKRLIIVDVSNFIFRAFFAIRPMHAPDGTPTNAVYGMFTMLLKLISDHRPTHIFLARDTKGGSFRNELYSEYKANRSEPPEELIPQFALIEELIKKMNLPTLSHDRFEADDIIGSAATQWKNEFDEILIASGDKDLMQFVDGNVKMLDTMKDKIYESKDVFEKMGVRPDQIVDYLSIVGDSSDNIPGMKGIGAVGAANLLKEYDTFENIISNKDKLKGKKVIEAFSTYLEDGLLSKRLVQIAVDVDLGHSSEETKIHFYPSPELEEFLKSLGFKSALTKIQELRFQFHLAQESDKRLSEVGRVNENIDSHLFHLPEMSEVQIIQKDIMDSGFENKLSNSSLASIRIKYTDEDFTSRSIDKLFLNLGEEVVYQFNSELALKLLKEIVSNKSIVLVSDKLKEDIGFLLFNNIEIECGYFDIGVAHFNINAGARHDIDTIIKEVFQKDLSAEEDVKTAEITKANFDLHGYLKEKLEKLELLKVYEEIDLLLIPVLARMENCGIRLNPNYLHELEVDLEKEIQSIESEVKKNSEGDINLNSPKQVGALLFEKLNLPVIKKTKTGYSTDADVLEELDGMNLSPIPGLLLTHRELGKILSTYVKALPLLLNKNTKRIHTNYYMTVAQTGRLSSTNPNLQNIPIRSEMGQKVRKAFIASPGKLLLSADYSQVELRLLAHFSEDPIMLQSFRDNLDIHTQTASEVLGISIKDVKSSDRAMAKTVNFGLMYGQSSFGLAQTLKISRTEAKNYIDKYFTRFANIKNFLDTLKEKAEQSGYAETFHGRKRFLPDINSQNRTIKAQAERMAINSPIQGTAADIIKLAMISIDKKIIEKNLKSKMLLQVHDELIFEVDEDELEILKNLVRDEMENVVNLKVPLTISLGIGANWYDLK